ncbi:MAG TPA: zinc-ribbon domain-containing protein [Polyangiaceae bacterium]|nr:zinc-ribbon domain-containing protein [Polyangiaceae bacterium]
MKISCDSCQSKFTVGDDKVAGNILRIRCKKCGSTLVVNGAEGTTTTEPADPSKDAHPVSIAPAPSSEGKAADDAKKVDADDAKKVDDAAEAKKVDDAAEAKKVDADDAKKKDDAAEARESIVAARREGSEKAADLFAGVDKAGSEPESAEGEDVDMKLTGERSPSSVLFSLGNLTKDMEKSKKEEESKTTAKGDGSGLIDIRSLTAAKSERTSVPPRVEDIMNLSGGGAFGAALAPPDLLAAPAADTTAKDSEEGTAKEEKGNNKIIFTIIGCAVFLGVAIVGAIIMTRPDPVATPTPTGPTSTLSGALAQNDPLPSATTTTAAPAPTETTSAKEPGQLTAPPSGGKPGPKVPGTPEPPAPSAAAPAPTAPPAPTKPLTLEEQMRKAVPTSAPTTTAAPEQGGSFDRAAASGSLNSVNIAGCKKPDGPTGAGHVTVTFGPSGTVTTAVVDGGDFPGTPVGGCIAGKYRSAHVPPFSGSPVKVGKSFNL